MGGTGTRRSASRSQPTAARYQGWWVRTSSGSTEARAKDTARRPSGHPALTHRCGNTIAGVMGLAWLGLRFPDYVAGPCRTGGLGHRRSCQTPGRKSVGSRLCWSPGHTGTSGWVRSPRKTRLSLSLIDHQLRGGPVRRPATRLRSLGLPPDPASSRDYALPITTAALRGKGKGPT